MSVDTNMNSESKRKYGEPLMTRLKITNVTNIQVKLLMKPLNAFSTKKLPSSLDIGPSFLFS